MYNHRRNPVAFTLKTLAKKPIVLHYCDAIETIDNKHIHSLKQNEPQYNGQILITRVIAI